MQGSDEIFEDDYAINSSKKLTEERQRKKSQEIINNAKKKIMRQFIKTSEEDDHIEKEREQQRKHQERLLKQQQKQQIKQEMQQQIHQQIEQHITQQAPAPDQISEAQSQIPSEVTTTESSTQYSESDNLKHSASQYSEQNSREEFISNQNERLENIADLMTDYELRTEDIDTSQNSPNENVVVTSSNPNTEEVNIFNSNNIQFVKSEFLSDFQQSKIVRSEQIEERRVIKQMVETKAVQAVPVERKNQETMTVENQRLKQKPPRNTPSIQKTRSDASEKEFAVDFSENCDSSNFYNNPYFSAQNVNSRPQNVQTNQIQIKVKKPLNNSTKKSQTSSSISPLVRSHEPQVETRMVINTKKLPVAKAYEGSDSGEDLEPIQVYNRREVEKAQKVSVKHSEVRNAQVKNSQVVSNKHLPKPQPQQVRHYEQYIENQMDIESKNTVSEFKSESNDENEIESQEPTIIETNKKSSLKK
jgi:hypothetical protein